MFNKKFRSGGFVFAEFAIALPLLILLGFGMFFVSTKIFELGKTQLADYVLEEEAHDVLSRLMYDARAAKKVEVIGVEGSSTLKFTYRTINEILKSNGGIEVGDVIADKEEKRVYYRAKPEEDYGDETKPYKIYYQRETAKSSPITGENYFGLTNVREFKFKADKEKKILYVTLEMEHADDSHKAESEDNSHRIKISTAVYMPSCEKIIQ